MRSLATRIVLKRAVPIEMIGRDVQDDRDLGMELARAFQLKARYLEHRPCLVAALFNQLNHRHADVAANQRRQPGLLENLADQSRRGGLAVGAGDGQDLPLESARPVPLRR